MPKRIVLPTILALAIGAAYWNGLHAPFQFDDVDAVVENVAIRHWWPFAEGLPASVQVAGRPIVALSYALNFPWAALDPFGYRIVNLLIHFACAVLLFATPGTSCRAGAVRVRRQAPRRPLPCCGQCTR